MSYVQSTSLAFIVGETITGESSGATAVISTLTEGSINIVDRYLFDDGQRDNFYDISRLQKKPSSPAPTGRLLIVFDYMEHGSGDMFTVDSYTDVAKQMEYEDIPDYTATKVDPDSPAPAGLFPLRDSMDFRPRVEDIAGSSSTLETIDEITGNSFDFYSRQYDGTGASTVDTNKPGSNLQCDLEFYLGKYAYVVMDDRGKITIIQGLKGSPLRPDVPADVMKLAAIKMRPFTFSPLNEDVKLERVRNQRFTMKDIGKINNRLSNVEKMTTLNMLERNAADFEVTDANGLNRFKSGFVVDNFQGHRVGDSYHKDYKNSMDFTKGTLRPTHVAKSVDLEESVTTDGARISAGYQKTGDLLTLPYTEVVLTEQPYASTIERVAPFLTTSWKGTLSIDPTSDNWFETEIAPDLIINQEGNFDAVVAAIGNNMGVVWNSWQTTWAGVVQRDDGGQPPPANQDWNDGDGGEGGEGGEGGKIVCTAMNQMYGFGSYRNAIWMKYQKDYMSSEEYQLGYHKLIMPLVKKMPTNKTIRVILERIAKRRTINLRKEMRGEKLPLYYKSMKYTVRPLFFAVGWLVKKKILSKTEV